MKSIILAATTAGALLLVSNAFAMPDNHSAVWHGHGNGHQANNDPGDTAKHPHNFDGAAAGNSGKSPAAAQQSGPKK